MFRKICFLVLVITIFSVLVFALVQERTISSRQLKFDIPAGQRIIVVGAGATVTIKPTTARIFDYKVPEGNSLSGVLVVK